MKPPRKMPDWAYNQMIEGLQKLLVLRLQGAPPADTISALAAVWEEALTPHTWAFNEQLDHNRLPTAFKRVIQHAENGCSQHKLSAKFHHAANRLCQD